MTLSGHVREDISSRIIFVTIAVIIFFLCLIGRLVYLQIIQGDEYRAFASNHGLRAERLPAPRGRIRDRNGEMLVWNRPSYQVVAIPQYLGNISRVQSSVASVLDVDSEYIAAQFARRNFMQAYQPLVLRSSASLDEVSRVLAWKTPWPDPSDPIDLRGIEVQKHFARAYRDPSFAPHVFGYIKEIDQKELDARNESHPGRYYRGDSVGADGLEAFWDLQLRGYHGYKERLVDARGYETATPEWLDLAWKKSQCGSTLYLAIDATVQDAARLALKDKTGSVVAINPKTGGIMAMVSEPEYDIEKLSGPNRQAYWRELVNDPDKPLYQRALMGAYPPGSIYKIVMATAALAEKIVTPEEKIYCGGGLNFGGRRFGCWNRGGHGYVNLRESLAQSCDVYYYTMGIRLGPDKIAKWATKFGLGRATGIDLPHERTGLIPTKEWKLKVRGQPWQPGETLSIAIGQGYDLVTPLQAAVMMATLANGGRSVRPYLAERFTGSAAEKIDHSQSIGAQVIPPEIVKEVQGGVIDVVEKGTARRLDALKLKIAGKTGTAQVVSLSRAQGMRKHLDHAWFVAYAPHDNPEIAIAVLVEHGGGGSRAAAPVAGEVIKAYFDKYHPKKEEPNVR